MGNRFASLKTVGGYLNGEVASAMQKSIRQGDVGAALFWATELDLSGYGNYVWKRLRTIASEDVGMADPMACVAVWVLNQNWLEARKNEKHKGVRAGRLFLMQAITHLALARKNRMMDHMGIVMYEGDRNTILGGRPEIPDDALDRHTAAGNRLGRGWTHFFDQGARLENVGGPEDTWEARARTIRSDDRPGAYEDPPDEDEEPTGPAKRPSGKLFS